jgi:glycerol uptake facilitator-like aquaporin
MWINLIAEFAGAMLLVISILITGNPIFIGATLALCIYLLGNTSGSHVNPAVSIVFYMKGDMNLYTLITYTVAQMLGGISAFYAVKTFT